MRRVGITPKLRDFLAEIPLVNDWLATVTDRLNIFKSAINPTVDEVPENQWLVHKNTASGVLSLWANDDGALVYTPLGATGTGDVHGPAIAVNNNVVFFDGVTGKLIKDSGLTLSGTNTGDQTSIVGISGTKLQYNASLSDGDFLFNADALGTPSSGTLTNCTGLPISTGVSGLAAGIATFLTTPSSANLAAALTDKTGTGANVFATSPTLVTPNIGVATGTSLTATAAIITSGTGIGYTTGAGGTVTQATNKTTGVTLNKLCGTITMNAAALASQTTAAFVLTNSTIQANDLVVVVHNSVGTLGAYTIAVTPATGSATIHVRNVHTASLSEAIVLRFAVIKAVIA